MFRRHFGQPIGLLLVLAVALGLGLLFGFVALPPPVFRWTINTLTVVCSLWVMYRTSRLFNPARLSISSFFYVFYVPMIFVPAFVVFSEHGEPTRSTYLFAVASVMITVPLGVWAANAIARYSRGENDRFYDASLTCPSDTQYEFHVSLVLFAAAAVLTAAYLSQLELTRIPLVYMFQHPGDSEELTFLREASFKMFDPRWNTASSSVLFYAFLFLRTLVFPFLILVAFGYYLGTRERRWLLLFVAAIALGGFYAAASIARAPLAAIVMRLMFVYYLFHGGRISRRVAVVAVVLVGLTLAFPVLVTALAYGSAGFGDALFRVGRRFFYTPADDLYVYFEIFPRVVDYQYGGTLAKPLLKLFELPYFYIENYVYLYQFPNGLPTGHANAAFLSNLHADFGPVGVVAGGFVAGMLMQAVQIWLVRRGKNVLTVAMFAFMMYAFWVLNFGSITSVLGTNGVIPVLVLAWGFRACVRVARTAAPRGRAQRLSVGGLRA